MLFRNKSIMKRTNNDRTDFEGKPKHPVNYFSDKKLHFENTRNERFIVPWQMVESKENKILVK